MTEENKDVKLMALDDVIKAKEKEGKGSRLRYFRNRRNRRSYVNRRYNEQKPKADNRRRIVVENLNKEMQNPELQKLFEQCGKLTRCGIKFDKLGQSKGTADIEFSSHDECVNAINKLDNAEINGEKIRVKYAPNQYSKYGRRTRSAGDQRRNLRKINRTNRRGSKRIGRRGVRDRSSNRRKGFGQKRRNFTRTLGRRRQEKKQK